MWMIDGEQLFEFLSDQLVKESGAFSKGVNKGLNIARSAIRNVDAVKPIDLKVLPIVQELRKQLERVTRERDALLKEFAGDCGMCLHYEDCAKKRTSCGGADWEWYGLQKEVQDDG